MSKLQFKPDIPDSLRPEIEGLLAPLEWLVPDWCQLVNVHWDAAGDGEAAANTVVHWEYRWASITFFPTFFDQSDPAKSDCALHEALHIVTAPLCDYASRTFEALLKEDNPKFHQHVAEELRIRYEGMVQDLSKVIYSKLSGEEQ